MKIKLDCSSFLSVFVCCVLLHSNLLVLSIVFPIICLVMLFLFPSIGARLSLLTYLMSPDVGISPFLNNRNFIVIHSVFLDSLGGITIGLLMTVFVLIICLWRVNYNSLKINSKLLLCVFFPLIIPLYGFALNPLLKAVSGSSILFSMLVGFLLCHIGQIEVDEFVSLVIKAIMSIAIVNIVISAIFVHFGMLFFGNIGDLFPIVVFYLNDFSMLGRVIVLLLLGWNILLHPARSRIFGYLYVILLKIFSERSFKRTLSFSIVLIVFVLLACFLIMPYLPEKVLSMLFWKFSSVNIFNPHNTSSYTRLLELKNILHKDFSNIFNFLFGSGYGGSYRDLAYPFPKYVLSDSAFSNAEIMHRVFYKAHLNFSVLLLNMGVLLTLVTFISILWFSFIRVFSIIGKNVALKSYKFLYFLPIWLVFMYNQKTYIIFGFFIFYLNEILLISRHAEPGK